jgi:subtilisin family serine protease
MGVGRIMHTCRGCRVAALTRRALSYLLGISLAASTWGWFEMAAARGPRHAPPPLPTSDTPKQHPQHAHPHVHQQPHAHKQPPAHQKMEAGHAGKAPHSHGAGPVHSKQSHHAHGKASHAAQSKQTTPAPQPKQAAPQPKQAAPQPKQSTSGYALPALQGPPPTPAPQQTEQAPAQGRPPETAALDTNNAALGQPMRVGGPRDPVEPEPRSLVKSADEKAKARKAEERGPTISLGVGAPPLANTYRQNEILTGRLSPALRDRLTRLEYEVRESSVPGLTRILLPPNRNAWEIASGLQSEFQGQGFGLNYIYLPYRQAATYSSYEHAVEDAPMIVPMAPNPSIGCTTERCYGRRLVGWQDHLAACAKGVKVGVIDTGYDANHPAFAKREVQPNLVMGSQENAGKVRDWHGTAVLSLLAGAAKSSTPGLIPDADFIVADAFVADAFGKPQTDTVRLLEALDRLEQAGAQIVNMSIVGPPDDILHGQIAYLSKRKGVVFIAAAGNDGPDAAPGYPAAYQEVIAVTAVDSNGKPYRKANRGGYINVAAPGVRIWTAWPDKQEAMVTGTSFAAPFVTALAAVTYNNSPLKSSIDAKRQQLDPKAVTLAGFFIDKIGEGEDKPRETYGRGLAKAPKDCMPKQAPQPWLATVIPRLAAPTFWPTAVNRASLQ